MAILWADSFSAYGTNTAYMLNGLYAEVASTGHFDLVADPDPSGDGSTVAKLVVGGSFDAGAKIRRPFPSSLTTVGIALRLWMATLPPSDIGVNFITLSNDVYTAQCALRVKSNGALEFGTLNFNNSNSFTMIAESEGPVTVANAWQHIEAKIVANTWTGSVANADGSIEVRVNGVTVISDDACVTEYVPTGDFAQWSCHSLLASSSTCYIKDLVAWDATGTYNNDFLGPVSVYPLVPASDVDLGGFTPSTGATGYDILAASPPDDTKYLSVGIPPQDPASFTLTQLPEDVTSVRGIVSIVRAKNIDGGDGNLQVSLVGTAANDGSDRPITAAFTYWTDIFEEDPDTSAAYTPAKVGTLDIKLNRTAVA